MESMETMTKVIVTGDRGYIGAVLVDALFKKKYDVVGIDTDFFSGSLGQEAELAYKKITKDIRDVTIEDFKGAYAVIHLAGLSNDPLGAIDRELTFAINHEASVQLARLSKEAGVERFFFFSSCSVYGGSGDRFLNEKDEVNPLTPYAESKILAEKEILALGDGLFTPLVLRNATVYGYSPKLRLDLVINDLVAQSVVKKELVLSSDGKAWRPFIHVKDLARITVLLLKATKRSINQQIINIGSTKENYRIIDIAKVIKKLRPHTTISPGKGGTADRRNYKVNFQKLHKVLPTFSFSMTLTNGISELISIVEKQQMTADDLTSEKYIRLKRIRQLSFDKRIDAQLRWMPAISHSDTVGIDGVFLKQLKRIPDERGGIYHMLRRDDAEFQGFGEIYFSKSYPGVIKGWHTHSRMTLNYCVIEGMVKLVLFDARENSKTHKRLVELFIGDDNYCLVQIPPGVVNGYKTIGIKPSILANCATEPHDPVEISRIDPFSKKIPYDWKLVMK